MRRQQRRQQERRRAAAGSSSNGGLPTNNPGTPQKGGTITYGLEGKTTAFCPPRGQWAISGIMVASAVYDTLTQPTDQPNVYAPYLAKSVTGSADYKTWTIVLRSGIKFQDGEPLNAAAVKQNIDAWRKGILLGFVFKNIADVTTLGRRHRHREHDRPVGRVPGVPLEQRSHRDRGARPAEQRRHLRHQHDRHRAVQARRRSTRPPVT